MLIGIHGVAWSGKDTIAQALSRHLELECYAFATPVKRGLSESLGIPLADLYDENLKDAPYYMYGKSLRELMQGYGDFLLSISPTVLLDGANRFLAANGGSGIITDVRPSKEAVYIRNRGGVVIHLIRPNNPLNMSQDRSGHRTEKTLPEDLIDYTVVNDGSLEDLMEKVRTLALHLAEKEFLGEARTIATTVAPLFSGSKPA